MPRVAILAVFLALLPVAAPAAAPATQTSPPVLWLTIAGSADAPKDRNVGWNIKRAGWSGFVREVAAPAIKKHGIRRVLLHNPFGARPNEGYFQFDQYLHAQDEKLKWLTNGFSTAWRPVTKSGVEVIAYIGALEGVGAGDPDFKNLPPDEWIARALASVRPLLDAKCSIALDVASHTKEDSRVHRFAQLLVSLGVKVYVEPRPRKDCPHWLAFPVIAEDAFWQRSDPATYADSAAWAANTLDVRGEVIRFVRGYSQPVGDQRKQVAAILADGNTAAVEMPYFEAAD